MGDNFFGDKHNRKHHDYHHKDKHYRDNENNNTRDIFHNHDSKSHKHEDTVQQIMSMLMTNKKLLAAAIMGGVVLFGVAIFILISLLPMISSTFESINKNGVKGAVDSALPIINKLLSEGK
jgi:ABC-type nickel/cobalt efflux system permease component RcnA